MRLGDMRHADCDGLKRASCKTFDICKAREPGMASYLETNFAHLHHCTATRFGFPSARSDEDESDFECAPPICRSMWMPLNLVL
jgi:hypothetical protein